MIFSTETDQVISLDEIGIATARHGDFVLRSAFQTIFRPGGDGLRAVAAESFLRPFREGLPLPPRPFLVSLDVAERAFVERVAVALHLANHGHVGVDGIDHLLGLGSAFGAPDEAAGAVAEHLALTPPRHASSAASGPRRGSAYPISRPLHRRCAAMASSSRWTAPPAGSRRWTRSATPRPTSCASTGHGSGRSPPAKARCAC